MMRRLQLNGVAGGDGIGNRCNSVFNRFFGTVLLFMVMTSGTIWGQGTETFENIPTGSASSSATRTWAGAGGTWTATQARTDQTINGKAINYRLSGVITSPTITGGIGSITMTTKLPFSDTAGNLTVKVNGTTVGTIPYATATQTTTIPNINISINAVITVEGTSARVSVDDLSWTAYSAGFTATFKGNGATGGGTGGTGADYTQTASTTTALTTHTFTRIGYTFAGWSTTAGGALAYADGANYAFGADITLHARWTPNNNNITFDKNHVDATGTMANQTIATAATAALNANGFTRPGYTFGGWATTSGGTAAYADGASYTMGTGNATLYAVWITDSPFIDYTGTLTAFNTEYGTASAAQTLTVSGINLTGNLNLSIPGTLFEYSTDGISYSNTLSIAPSSGTVNATVYLRIKANVVPNSYSGSGNISSSGATIKTFGFPLSTVSLKNLTVTGISANDKTYDGTTTASLSGVASITGIVGTDVVGLSGSGIGSFDTKNAGIGKTVTVSGYTLTGTHEFRYTLTQPTGVTAAITQASVTIAATADNKTYDGTTTATIHPSVSGVIGSDSVILSATGNFASPNAGTGITVNFTGVSLGGADGGNYSIANLPLTAASADILKANQTITFGTLADKTTADAPFNLTATASSGLAVTYSSSLPSVASISGSTVTPTGIGTTVITASQAGDGNYNAATDVTQNQVVTSGPCFEGAAVNTSIFTRGGSTTAAASSTALRLASGSNSGNISTGALSAVSGNVTFKAEVRGWTSSETTFSVNLGGVTGTGTVVSTFANADTSTAFEWVEIVLNSVPSNPTLTISCASGQRITFRNIQIFCAPACTAPTTSATALTVTNPANSINSLNVNFTRGNGDGVLIIAKAGATPAGAPTSGTAYAVNDIIDGGVVVYKGTADGINTGTVQTIGSLLEGTQYQFSIYEYVAATNCYQTTALAGSGTTLYREIDIRGNSVSIVNNDATPSLTDHTDFGSTAVDGGTVTRTFTIHNTGNAFLTLSYMSIGPGDFSLTTIPSSPINGPGSTTFNITFNPSAVGLRTSTITIGNNDADENPYTFAIQGTGVNSNSSDIVADGTFTYTSNINYAAFQSATIPTVSDGAAAFRFTIRDGGATAADTDLLGTELTGITFNVANSANIRTARLYDGTTLISSTPTIGATIAFTGLSGTNVTAPDGGTKTLTLYVSFNTAVTDNDQLQFTVASATANASGSVFAAADAGGAASSITGDSNRIEVTADRLVFGTQPASSSINTNLAPFTLRFVDANGNLDFDTNRTVTLTATDGGVNMTAAASYSITAPHTGIVTVSTVQFTTGPQAAITITGSTTGLAFDNDDKSSPFNISTVVYTTNDYRTTSGGTWSTQNAGTATWQTWNGSSWVTSGRPTSTLNNVYIRHTVTSNGNTTVASIIAEGPNASEGTPGGNYTISHGSTFSLVEVQSGGIFNCNSTGVAFPTSGGSLIVDNGGKLIISAALTNVSNFWRGTENFKQGSIVEISDFSGALLASSPQISTNAANYYFGNLNFSGTTAITLIATNSATDFNLVENDLTLNNASNNILITSAAGKNIVINGNTIVNAGTLRGMSLLSSLTLNGNLEIHNGSVNISPTSNSSIVYGIKLKGDLKIFNSSSFITNDPDSELIFEGTGNGFTPETTQNVFASTTATITNVRFKVNAGAYVKLDSNITLGSAAAFTVNTGGTLDFGFDSSNNALQILGNAFESQAGSILKVTSPYGLTNIAPGATAGNVQVTVANRAFTALGDFHYIGKNAQATGNALPTNVRNLVVHNEGATNDLTITNANVNVNGVLTMTQGNIVSTASNLLSIGVNTTTEKGTLSYAKGVVKGTLRRYFSGTNSGEATGLFPLGTTATNQERFITLEYASAATTGGYIDAFFTEADMGDAGVTSLSSIPAVGACPAFTVLNTDESLYWTLAPQGGSLTNGTYKVSLRKESTSSVCKQTVLKREATNWLNPGTHLTGTDLTAEGDIIARREGMTGTLKDFGLGNGYCSITPVVYNGTWSATPTKNDAVLIEDDYTIASGNLLVACECVVAANATVTIKKDATFEIVNELTVEAGSDLIIEDGGSLVQVTNIINATTNNNSGNIKMHRYTKPMYRYDFTYWSSPVFANNDPSDDAASVLNGTEFSLKKLSPMTLFDKYFKWNHAASTQAWQTISVGAESMVPGRGYIVRAPQSYPVEGSAGNPAPIAYQDGVFIGKPNNGIVEHPVTGGAGKWNLIGNPYPSAISAASFLAANIDDISNPTANKLLDGTLYFWTHNTDIVPIAPGGQIYTYDSGDYASWNGTGSAATTDTSGSLENVPSGFIAAGQSFFVQGTNSGSVLFNNSMRLAGNNNQFFRPGTTEPLNNWDTTGKHRVWLNIKGQSRGFCQMLVGYVGEATNGLDRRFDGETFGGNQVLLYSVLEDKRLVIQGRALPFNNQDEVPLGYKSTINGTLTISIDHFDGLFEGQAIYLEDKTLNIVHDLKAGAYNFTTTAGTFNERFVLRYLPSEELGNPGHEQIANGLIVYQEEGKIMIKSQLEALEQVTVYDLLGRNIFDKSGIGQHTFSIQNVVMNEQPLIVKVKLANGQIVNKKIVH